jgi:uncharacterized PurR-regulated membrane protein YhhQ (DUF165 family)
MIAFIAAILMIEACAIALGGRQRSPGFLRSLILVQMILISLFAPKLFELGTFSSNIGSVFYATVVTCQCISVRRFGYKAAIENTLVVIGMMVLFYALLGIVGIMPITREDAYFAQAVDQIALTAPANSFVSLVAFAGSQVVLITILQDFQRWYGVPLAVTVAQAVDSAIFYPVVFRDLPLHDLTLFTFDGYITKLVCAVVLVPAYLFCVRKRATILDYT